MTGVNGLVLNYRDWESSGKSIWWMPWHVQAMKDVARCDKRRGVVSKL